MAWGGKSKRDTAVDDGTESASTKCAKLTPRRAKNLVGVAKVFGSAVFPALAPYVVQAAAVARDGVDRLRARRLGIGVGELAEYSGPGGALHARIVGAGSALAELAGRGGADREFAIRGRETLVSLAAAVRAAERMPTTRRRAAHRAVAAELDAIERELLRRLGL